MAFHLAGHRLADIEGAGPGERLDARGQVHALAEDVSLLVHHRAQVGADAQLHLPLGGTQPVALGHGLLQRQPEAHGGQPALELEQEAILHHLHFAATLTGQQLPDEPAMLLAQLLLQRVTLRRTRSRHRHRREHQGD